MDGTYHPMGALGQMVDQLDCPGLDLEDQNQAELGKQNADDVLRGNFRSAKDLHAQSTRDDLKHLLSSDLVDKYCKEMAALRAAKRRAMML